MPGNTRFFQAPMAGPEITKTVLVEIPAEYIPHTLSALESRKGRAVWVSDADYAQGLQGISRTQWGLLMDASTAIIEEQRKLYRLVDSIFNGRVYTVQTPSAPTTPAVVTPAIPDAPPDDIGQAPGLRRQLLDMQGNTPGGWLGFGGRPATIADLLQALRAGSEADVERVNTALDTLVGAGSGASIFNAIRGLLSDTAELGAEGGILAVLVASTMANAAMMGLQGGQLDALAGKLDRIITSLDGGGAEGPNTNVVRELAEIGTLLG